MECLEQMLNVSLLNIIANYVSPDCLKILNPNIKNPMVEHQVLSYLKYLLTERLLMINDDVAKSLMNDFIFVTINLYYYLGKRGELLLNDIIDFNNPLFKNKDFANTVRELINSGSMVDGDMYYGEELLLEDFCMRIKLELNMNNMYEYIKKCLESDTSNRVFYSIIVELPGEFYNKVDFPKFVNFILDNLKSYNSKTMDKFIVFVSDYAREYEIYNFVELFMKFKDKLSQGNIVKVLDAAFAIYDLSAYGVYANLPEKISSNPDQYIKLAMMHQEICKNYGDKSYE